ncbi:hypothetical protein B0A48_04037 [Cryoendolithus antarcticus]|uniref:Uncharacterized protein n=1 Tax=Cryoendolithus antarcticus TaxID=1507870 RepID=A0A1V8TH76_9PEZI|nr:hypothetical protein B0A48_04037 [Cryoendolithus antarcticus]
MSDPLMADLNRLGFQSRILPMPAPLTDAFDEANACWDLKDEADAALADAEIVYNKALQDYEEAVRLWADAHVDIQMREEREYVTMGEDIARWNARHWIPGLMQDEVAMWRAEVALRASVREVEAADQKVLRLGKKCAWANERFERWYQPYMVAERRAQEIRAQDEGAQHELYEQREEEIGESAADREAAQRKQDAEWERYEREAPERERQLKQWLAERKAALERGETSFDEPEESSADEAEEMSDDEMEEQSADEAEEMRDDEMEEQSADAEDEVRAQGAETDRASRAAVWEDFQQQHLDGRRRYEALAAKAQQMAAQAQQEERETEAAFKAESEAAWEKLQERERAESERKAREDQQGGGPPSPPPSPPPPPPRDPGAEARRHEREARRAKFAAGFNRANAKWQNTSAPVSDPVQHWYTYAQRALANYSQLTAFPAPPVIVRCSSMACASSGHTLQACECNVRATLERLNVDQLSRVRRSFHPDRFSACAPALRPQFQQMAREIFVVANTLYRGRTRRPSVWHADPEKK